MRVGQHKRPDRCKQRSKNNGRAEQRVVLTLPDRREHVEIRCKTPNGASVRVKCWPGNPTLDETVVIIEGLRYLEHAIQGGDEGFPEN